MPQTAWAGVASSHDRLSLTAVVVLAQAQDEGAFRSSRVAWVTAMLRRPGVDPWPSVHRALAQKAQGLSAKPNRFLH
jgi:predicted pyridoxine 5'-phosphate oxidase superfamily flavin-nucleotide-binding protein